MQKKTTKGKVSIKSINLVTEEWNCHKTDRDKWKYLMWNKKWFCLILDNDETYVRFSESVSAGYDIDDLPELNNFDDHIGCSHGVHILLEILNIEAEAV